MLALAMATQIDRTWLYMDIHQVVDDATLDVVLNPVDQEPTTNINHFDEGQIPARTNKNDYYIKLWLRYLRSFNVEKVLFYRPVILVRVKGLVVYSVTLDPFLKVLHGICLVAVLVVRA